MDHDEIESIRLLPVPALEELADGRSRRIYRYRFSTDVPRGDRLSECSTLLSYIIDKPALFSSEVVSVPVTITLALRGPRELDVGVVTDSPEDSWVFINGLRAVPARVESIIGRVESIDGVPRAEWHATRGGLPR